MFARKYIRLALLAAALVFSLCALIGCGQAGTDDDEIDDGADDDDVDDDDAADDDDSEPADPYEGMGPSGRTIDELLAISSHIYGGTEQSWTRDFEIERLSEAGVGLLRTDFSWSSIEPSDDDWRFDGYDVMVDLCADAGIKVDALLDYGVSWAMPGGSHDEIDPVVFADFAGHVAEHFSDRIDLYEVWNEENLFRFWRPWPNPERYGALLVASYEAVHENDADAIVLFGGLAPDALGLLGPNGLWGFLVQVHQEYPDVCDYFDALAIHPYTFAQQTSPEETVDLLILSYPNYLEMIGEARALLDWIGCPGKPIYLTETGWPHLYIDQDHQAAYLNRSLLLAASAGIEGYFWYTFWDGEGHAVPPTEDTFGLFTWPGEEPQAKPSYEALLGAHEMLGSSRYAGDLGSALGWPAPMHGLAFAGDEGRWTIALWHSDEPLDLPLRAVVPLRRDSDGTWSLFDQNGDLVGSGESESKEVEVTLRGTVSYLAFEAPWP